MEELCGERGEFVAREVHVCEVSCAHALFLEEGSRESGKRDISPHEMEGPSHLDGGPSILDGQHGVLIILHQTRVLPRDGVV